MSKANGSGNGHDTEWGNLGADISKYMSDRFYKEPKPPGEDPPKDPRDATDFRAVWDEIATDTATQPIIDYINGQLCERDPTLLELVQAFHDRAMKPPRVVLSDQIVAVIRICGGPLARRHDLQADVEACWTKCRQAFNNQAADQKEAHDAGVPLVQSVAAFIKATKPPEYLVEPIIQRSSLYTLTALTSHGKTAVLLYLALHIAAAGRPVAGKHTKGGRVVWFAGENPDDFASKVATACDHWDIDPETLDMVVIPGAFDMAGMAADAVKAAAAGGEVALVVIDTSAAYRFDDDEDSNANAISWARTLRQHFTRMSGRPAVIVATHPTKWADGSNLLPRGGGAFMNEVDGNLTLWADEEQNTTTLHWQGKFRGMTFSPISFALKLCPHPAWTLRNGDPVMVKLAVPVDGDMAPPRTARRQNGRPASDKADIARGILGDLLVTEGAIGWAPNGLPAVPKERWRTEFYARACIAEDKPDTRLKAFQRATDRLITTNVVAANQNWVWLTHPTVAT